MRISKFIKIISIILLSLLVLICFKYETNGETNNSEIIDYREVDVDYDKGLTLYGEDEERNRWIELSRDKVKSTYRDESDYFCYVFPREDARDAHVEIKYPKVRHLY